MLQGRGYLGIVRSTIVLAVTWSRAIDAKLAN